MKSDKKKIMSIAILVIVLCCACSILSFFMSTPQEDIKSEPEQTEIERNSSVSGQTLVISGEENEETIPLSKKPLHIGVYKKCDCTGAIHDVNVEPGAPLDTTEGKIEEVDGQQWKCIKFKNAIVSNYVAEYSGKQNGNPTDGESVINDPTRFDDTEIKVGCNTGEDYTTNFLQFNWKIAE